VATPAVGLVAATSEPASAAVAAAAKPDAALPENAAKPLETQVPSTGGRPATEVIEAYVTNATKTEPQSGAGAETAAVERAKVA
jgi:hypothetical protein